MQPTSHRSSNFILLVFGSTNPNLILSERKFPAWANVSQEEQVDTETEGAIQFSQPVVRNFYH